MAHKLKKILGTAFALCSLSVCAQNESPASIWFQYNDRFIANDVYELENVDSVIFTKTQIRRFKTNPETGRVTSSSYNYRKEDLGKYRLDDVVRYIMKPSTYSSNDFTQTSSQWCFTRSQESEHFIIFWENGLTKKSNGDITYDGYTCNVNTLLDNAEKIWNCYIDKLGFLEPGNSTTDKVKIEMFIVKKGWSGNNNDWRADGSGVAGTYYSYNGSGATKSQNSGKVGVFHCTPRAATARGGHTQAHEIGHTFQYLVAADLGSSHGFGYGIGQGNDNEWWEDCANWQAYKVYPARQYSDGEYYELYLKTHHLNIHHEDIRYNNCFYQDWWCQQHGMNTVARVWRESIKPEDPSQAYMRIFGLDADGYAKEMYDAFSHLASIDIDGVRSYGKAKIGKEPQRLKAVPAAILTKYLADDNDYWIVDPDYCPQNYGYNANPLKVPAAGTLVKAHFKGLPGCDGYNKVKTTCAGWRYGIVAYCSDGTRVYSEMGKDKEGDVEITVPEKCTHMWLVVMGAPTEYWSHCWTSGVASSTFPNNNEQWPYAVKFDGTSPLGVTK